MPADLMTAVTTLMPDIVAAAQREPEAEAVAKAGAANSGLADVLPCMLLMVSILCSWLVDCISPQAGAFGRGFILHLAAVVDRCTWYCLPLQVLVFAFSPYRLCRLLLMCCHCYACSSY